MKNKPIVTHTPAYEDGKVDFLGGVTLLGKTVSDVILINDTGMRKTAFLA